MAYIRNSCALPEDSPLWPYIEAYEKMPKRERREINRACDNLSTHCPKLGPLSAFELVSILGIWLASNGKEGLKDGTKEG
jgi:hypothetical protein